MSMTRFAQPISLESDSEQLSIVFSSVLRPLVANNKIAGVEAQVGFRR